MSKRVRTSTRQVKVKESQKTLTHTPTKWSESEIEKYLQCIMENGHKNLEKLEACFPDRNLSVIKSFLRTAYDTAIRLEKGHSNLDAWLEHCKAIGVRPPWKDSLQIAQVIKYLSVDGLFENHPLPSQSQGINFPEAYRLIYQALMGYPIQPVNNETSNFILSTFKELAAEIRKEITPIQNVAEFLKGDTLDKSEVKNKKKNVNLEEVKPSVSENNNFQKPLRVYQRKRPNVTDTAETPSLKIIVQSNDSEPKNSGTKDFSVTIDGSAQGRNSTVLNVPVPVSMESLIGVDKDEQQLLDSLSYNPFKIPEKWLKEPVFINLLTKISNQ